MTYELESGYSTPRWKGTKTFRAMTIDDFSKIRHISHFNVIDKNGKVREVRQNGKPKTWKTRPLDMTIPFKYGQYEYGYITFKDGIIDSGSPIPVMEVQP